MSSAVVRSQPRPPFRPAAPVHRVALSPTVARGLRCLVTSEVRTVSASSTSAHTSFSRRSAHSSSPPPAPPRPTRPCRPSTPWTCHLQVRILCLCDQYNIVKPCLLQKPIVCDSTVKNKMWQLRSSSRFTELSFNVLLTGDTFLKTRWVEPTPQ